MKVLLDTCVWGGAAKVLEEAGRNAEWVGEQDDPGDEAILKRANAEGRVLITLDKDFGELAVVRGLEHKGIVRLVGVSAQDQGPVCEAVLSKYGAELAAGAIVTVEPGRTRIRPAESGKK